MTHLEIPPEYFVTNNAAIKICYFDFRFLLFFEKPPLLIKALLIMKKGFLLTEAHFTAPKSFIVNIQKRQKTLDSYWSIFDKTGRPKRYPKN
jgi:hypothetical protein